MYHLMYVLIYTIRIPIVSPTNRMQFIYYDTVNFLNIKHVHHPPEFNSSVKLFYLDSFARSAKSIDIFYHNIAVAVNSFFTNKTAFQH